MQGMLRPGTEPRTSCLPGRRANHYTISALSTLYAKVNIYEHYVFVSRSDTFFTATGDTIIFGPFN